MQEIQKQPSKDPDSDLELAAIRKALTEGAFVPTEGGFSQVRRGIVELSDGRSVFAKLAVDAQTAAWIQKEVAVYRWLNSVGFAHVPKLLGADAELLVLPDLRAFDWKNTWDRKKLDAVLAAQAALAMLKPTDAVFRVTEPFTPYDFQPRALQLGDDRLWNDLIRKATDWGLSSSQLALLQGCSRSERSSWPELVASHHFCRDELVHMDLRADNIAYDPEVGLAYLVDWNWLERSSAALDRTLFLVSLYGEPAVSIPPSSVRTLCDTQAALAGASFWLSCCLSEPFKPGDPDKLRMKQCIFGIRALEIARGV